MTRWPDRRIIDLFGIELPIIRASMAGAAKCSVEGRRAQQGFGEVRAATKAPVNLNFFARLALL
jgi:nitronate monooxygenase